MKRIYVLLACFLATAHGLMAQSTISPGRAIEIQIKGVPSEEMARINGTYTVSDGGTIRMPLLEGSIRAAGLSPTALAQNIEASYRAAKIYTTPAINVIATSNEALEELVVTVGGYVRSPGPVRYTRGLTLYDAIQAAKGATEFGSMERVRVIRGKQSKQYNLKDPKHMNTPLQPRDTIQVPQKNIWGH